MADKNGREVRVAPGREDCDRVTQGPDCEAGEPLLEANAEGGGDRAVYDRDCAWRSAQEYRFGKRTVDRCFEASAVLAS
jgi:hypothetical protein